MPVWIEMRCADQDQDYANGHPGEERCWSHDNSGCGVLGGDTATETAKDIRKLFALVRKAKWEHIKGHGWICPHCSEQRKRRAVAESEVGE